MSHTKVKTTYAIQGDWASTDVVTLYCDHNHSTDFVTFYWENGEVVSMIFQEWESDNDLWDAMNRLWNPFKEQWGDELKEGVEYYHKAPWESV